MRTQSIHPRIDGSARHERVSTFKAPSKERIERVAARMEKHLDEHPNDGPTKAHLSKLRAKL